MSKGSYTQAAFYYQNQLAALKILDSLKHDSDIISIELENYAKGKHIDDIIITRTTLIQYFQVKWVADNNKSYTITNLTESGEENGKSLIKQLAEGFLSIQPRDKEIEIILYSPRKAGAQDRPSKNIDKSLKSLIIDFHSNYIISDCKSIKEANQYAEFAAVLGLLRQASGLDDDQFSLFFKKLRFELGSPAFEDIQQGIAYRLSSLGLDSTHSDKLIVQVVNWSITGELVNKDKVLDQLGISNRFQDRISHYFKVDDTYYIGNDRLFKQLDKTLEELPGGYVLVEGVPGSGKSTALAKYKDHNPKVKFAYYCFIPDERTFGDLRQLSDYFLKSLCIAIETNFPHIDFPIRYSDQYQEKLALYLDTLGNIKDKMIFIIDGLDHVDRNRAHLDSPLTSGLITTLPENIFFVISSQYLEALPPAIKTVIRADKRRQLQIARFSEHKIKKYLDNKGIYLQQEELDVIVETSEGIPLYLHYISELLVNQYPAEIKRILANLPKLVDGKINTYHHLLYEQIRDQEVATWVLALLAFRKEYTGEKIIKQLLNIAGVAYNEAQIHISLKTFRHLLKEHEATSYSIFHNSFREFILKESLHLKEPINNALIKYYEDNLWDDEAFRNYYQHLFDLGHYDKILDATDDSWIQNAWNHFKPLHEIDFNLDIAWKASVEIENLSEFVRICFLKQQLGVSTYTLEQSSDFDFATYLLHCNQPKESLRTIWDGEKVVVRPRYFEYYCTLYLDRTGQLLPKNIALRGFFALTLEKMKGDEYEQYIQARALYVDILPLIEEIRSMKWTSGSGTREFSVKKYTAAENKKVALNNIRKLIHFLAKHTQTVRLYQIINTIPEKKLKHLAIAELVGCLLPQGSTDAQQLLEQLDYNRLTYEDQLRLIQKLVKHLPLEAIKKSYPIKITIPSLQQKPVTEEMNFRLKDQITDLYPLLQLYYLYHPRKAIAFSEAVKELPMGTSPFYEAVNSMAVMWMQAKQGKISNREDFIEQIKSDVLDMLNVPPYMQSRGYGSDSAFIGYSIYKLYRHVFRFIDETCSDAEIADLINHWIKLEYNGNGYVSYQNSIEFALAIHHRPALSNNVAALIRDAETIVRDSQETTSLVSELYRVGNTFGICGFPEESKRIYQELLPLACGVSSRKDYQFSDIVDVLESAHVTHPEKTLGRLAEIYLLLHQVRHAGNPRMFHICQSILISFVFKIHPSLAFKLLEKEDLGIDRDEALAIILRNSIPDVKEDQLLLIWPLIKTITKWDQDGLNSAESIYQLFFDKVLGVKQETLIIEIYDHIKKVVLTIKDKPAELVPIIKKVQDAGYTFNFLTEDLKIYDVKSVENSPAVPAPDRPRPNKFRLPVEDKTIPELIEMASESFERIPEYIKLVGSQRQANNINHHTRSTFYQVVRLLEPWYSSLKPFQQRTVDKQKNSLFRTFTQFKGSLMKTSPEEAQKKSTLVDWLRSLINALNGQLRGLGLKKFFQNSIDLDGLIENYSGHINWKTSRLAGILTDQEVLEIIQEIPFEDLSKWEAFAKENLSGENRVAALTSLAKRLAPLDDHKALKILDSAFETMQETKFREKEIELELMGLYFSLSPLKAKKKLLASFMAASKDYPGSILYYLDTKLIIFADRFEEPDLYEKYFEANFRYNQKLAQGLPRIEIDSEFIKNHREENGFANSICDYLISLFDYPKVKVRQQALQALFDLLKSAPDLIKYVIKSLLQNNSNRQEHGLNLLYSLSIDNPHQLIGHKDSIRIFLTSDHFNLTQSAVELIMILFEKGIVTDAALLADIQLQNKVPAIPVNCIIRDLQRPPYNFGYNYQRSLMKDLDEARIAGPSIREEIYTNLVDKGFDNTMASEAESRIHKSHNMNANFDTVEIYGPYFSSIQKEINTVFKKRINNGDYEDRDIERLKKGFRLYDPSDLLVENTQKPAEINWILPGISPADFMAMNDGDELLNSVMQRQSDWLPLYENGSQRTHRHPDGYSCYFELSTFLSPADSADELRPMLTDSHTSFLHLENEYRTEIFKSFPTQTTLINGRIYPITGVTYRNFRSQSDYSVAIPLPEIANLLQLTPANELSSSYCDQNNNIIVDSFRWQEKIDEHGRRRFEPNSEGYLLRIKKDEMLRLAELKKMNLFCYINLRRSIDKYIAESEMKWASAVLIKKLP